MNILEELKIMIKCFAKADARINDDFGFVNSVIDGGLDGMVQKILDFFYKILIDGDFCMVLGVPSICIRMTGTLASAAT